MIPQRNLSLLSNRLAKAGRRRIPESVLERDYCLSWFLIGLSRSPLLHRLAFKGGTALKKCYFAHYRFSEDLDFTLIQDTSWEEIRQGLDVISAEVRKASGVEIRFDRLDKDPHENCYTFYLAYEGPLPRQYIQSVKVDITRRERIVDPLKKLPVLQGYEEYDDLPRDALIQVYSLDEIASEKIVALHDPARNEPRDLYDLWFLTSQNHVHVAEILPIVESKLEFRGRKLGDAAKVLPVKEARLRKLWTTRLEAQMNDLPEFQGVYRPLRSLLRKAGVG